MACIDYGAILKVDGNFVNKNEQLFMNASDTGYMIDSVVCENGTTCDIAHNYYVYAGDQDLMLCFYKYGFAVVCGDKMMQYVTCNCVSGEIIWLSRF